MSTPEPQRRCRATTAAGKPCQGVPMHGSDLCPPHQGLAGRKTTLTPELADQLSAMLAAGNYITVACRAVGLPRATFGEWMRRGQSEAEPDAPFRSFRERVEQALAKGEVRNVAAIAKAATDGSWQAAAWLLERQHPERWARPSVRVREEGLTQPEPEAAADPFAEVDELARRRATRSAV